MYKMLIFLKRRAGMSREDFIAYYEEHHRRLGEKHIQNPQRYLRRYLEPFQDPYTGADIELDYDVITEVWFADRAAFEASAAHTAQPDVMAELIADEEKLFDRSKIKFAGVDERESVFG